MQGPVVHVIWHLDIGGGELFLRDLACELAARDISQQIFTIGPPGPLAFELAARGIPVTAFRKSTTLGLLVVFRMAKALRRLEPRIVQTHGEAGSYWGLLAARLAGLRVVSLVYQNYDETPLKMMASRILLRWPERVIAGSRDVARFLIDTLDVPGDSVVTIPCGIVPVPALPRRRSCTGGPVLVTVGRLVERKGHRVLLEALPIVRARYPTVTLRIVGDGPLRRELERAALDAGVADAVEFAGTVYPTGRMLASADVFVFPSLVEPQGLAILEAVAANLPVVASRTGGIPELLDDGLDGVLATPGDPADLASAILRMLDDPALRAACVARATGRLREFRLPDIADAYIDVYRHVARESKR